MREEDVQYYRFHPKVLAAYKEADHIKDYLPRAEEENEKNFWLAVADSKKPVKRQITKLIRIKVGKKEYFYYHEQVKSQNIVGTPIHFYHRVGYVEIPNFIRTYNEKTRQLQSTDIEGFTQEYELAFPQDFTEDIANLIVDDCDLTLINKGKHYGGYSLEQFLESSFEDLLMYGKFGTISPVIIEEVKKQEAMKRRAK